jgi:metal-dependent amidase/aminoacylase/carboxypeptidase family protein
VGAAAGVKSVLPDVGGTVVALGTPGEEGGGGKNVMMREGAFAGLDAMMLIYPGMDNIAHSRSLAVTGVRFEFFGKAAHAAARPELGINALDALLLAFGGINALRQQIRSDARIHGIIRDGGKLSMVIPDYTSADIRVRANDERYLLDLVPRVIACFEGAAAMTGARLQYQWNRERIARPLLSNEPLAHVFAGAPLA